MKDQRDSTPIWRNWRNCLQLLSQRLSPLHGPHRRATDKVPLEAITHPALDDALSRGNRVCSFGTPDP